MNRMIYTVVLLVFAAGMAQGQRLVTVLPDVVDGLAQTIKADSVARMNALPTQTIYMLKRNGYYPCVSAIDNTNYFLHIKAESGPGYRPLLVPSPTAGTTYAYMLNFRFNGKLEGLTLDASRPTGGVNNRYINVYNSASLWVKDCEVMHDRGSAFALIGDSTSLYIDDSFIHSCGHPKSVGGNGRIVDVRSLVVADSVVIRNTTFFNLTDRIIRIMGTKLNYLKFDHNTGFTTQGFHGALQTGKAAEIVVTNNIFYNPIAFGSFNRRTAAVTPNISEQTQPEKNLMYVVTMDTSYLVPTRKVTVRNNNVWWDQKVKDVWAKYPDSTRAPGIMTPTIMKMLGADSTKAHFTEPLTFTAAPANIYNFLDSSIAFPNSITLPENWSYIYQEADGLSPVNGSYGTTSASYTKADGGLPLGDLNWYPAKKAVWLLTDVKATGSGVPENYSLSQNYPNPFNPSTTFTFSMSKAGLVTLTVYDMLGREVATLVNNVANAGTHSITWNAAGMSSGVYFYKMHTGSFTSLKKMVLIR